MKHSSFGAPGGRLVVYFHGAPGGISEAQILHADAKQHGLRVICQDRFAIDRPIVGDRYFQTLANDVASFAQGERVDIVGFSIGAFVALQVSRHMPEKVRSLHLISPAAPLESADSLNSMAGGKVFWLAKNMPWAFKLLSYWQGLLAAMAPKLLYRMLFSSAAAGDRELAECADFEKFMGRVLRESFCGHVSGYLRDVQAYVSPCETSLEHIFAETQLWHGDQDNWSPKEMSEYLHQRLPHCMEVHRMQGLSHYSTLYAAAPRICAQLGLHG
jgi:pimeloyl-ACP methyl ester carboxylesterase